MSGIAKATAKQERRLQKERLKARLKEMANDVKDLNYDEFQLYQHWVEKVGHIKALVKCRGQSVLGV